MVYGIAQAESILLKCEGTEYKNWTNCFGKEKIAIGVYEGEYLNGKPNGQGTFTYNDGSKYVGQFKDSKFNGQGTLTLANGVKYVGEWKDSKWHGQGTLTDFAYEYVGVFKDCKQHGQGTTTFVDGTVVKDIFKDGERVK